MSLGNPSAETSATPAMNAGSTAFDPAVVGSLPPPLPPLRAEQDRESGPTAPRARPRGRMSLYLAAWALLAALAVGYLAALAVRPDLVAEHIPMFRQGEPETNQGQRATSRALAEVQSLRQSISQVQMDMARLRADVSGSEERQRTMSTRLAFVEDKIGAGIPPVAQTDILLPGAARSASKESPRAATAAAAEPAPAKVDSLAGKAEALPAKPAPGKPAGKTADAAASTGSLPTAVVAAAGSSSAIDTGALAQSAAALAQSGSPASTAQSIVETGSIATAAKAVVPRVLNTKSDAKPVAQAAAGAATAAPATAAVSSSTQAPATTTAPATTAKAQPPAAEPAAAPERDPLGVRLASSTSVEALRLNWSLLAERHPAQLRPLEPRYVTRGPTASGDPSFDLVAGPFKSTAEARRMCKALEQRGISCQVGAFIGNAL